MCYHALIRNELSTPMETGHMPPVMPARRSHGEGGFLDTLPPKTAFGLGMVTAVLSLGTLGFLLLGGCLLKGTCELPSAGTTVAAAPTDVGNLPADTAGPVPPVSDDDWIRGDKDAKVTIVEYSDFQCPFCARFHPTMQQIMTEYAGEVRWVYRHFPLSFHPEAEPAAEAAECAGEQGKFWEYGDKLIENQAVLGAATYAKIAADLGLNKGKFDTCLSSDRALAKIRAQAASGATAGVSGTPGSFVIGSDGSIQEIRGALPFESVKAAVDAAL